MGTTIVKRKYSYILDECPGARAAYGLRKMRSDYLGNCIRVRRDSDNTEQDIGFNGDDLDEASLTSFCSGSNGYVTTWYGQATGINLTQSTTTNQPKIYDSGTGIVVYNGRPGVLFNGTSTFLSSTIGQPSSVSLFAAYSNRINDGINSTLGGVGSDVSGGRYMLLVDLADTTTLDLQSRNVTLTQNAQLKDNNDRGVVAGVVLSDTENYVATMGQAFQQNDGTSNGLGFTGINLMYVGILRVIVPTNYLNAILHEFIYYDSDQRSSRDQITFNMNNYYRIY